MGTRLIFKNALHPTQISPCWGQVTFCCSWPKLISSNEINLNSEMKMQQKKPEKSGFGISPRDEAIYPVQGHL